MAWEHFPHGADIGVRGSGRDVAEAFEQAALALTAIVVEPSRVRNERSIAIACDAGSLEDLFVEWLNSVIFEMAHRQMVFAHFRLTIENHRLTASASGESLDPDRHEPAIEPKGATYTMLHVVRRPDATWEARCIVDV